MADVIDVLFGCVRVEVGSGHVEVSGDALPPVVLVRAPDAAVRVGIPIGTRDASALALTVDGEPVELRPARGGLTRRSYRVAVRRGADDLLFTPSSPTTARLVRGRRYRGDNELGTFERADGSLLPARWSEDVSALGVRVAGLGPLPWEAAVGYALAAAFGTGAQFFLGLLLEGSEHVSGPG